MIISTPTPEFPEIKGKNCRQFNPQWFNKYSLIDCSLDNLQKPIEFFISKDGKYYHLIKKLNQITSEHKNIYLFDALNALCPKKICKFTQNDQLLYRDHNHVSNYAAKNILAPMLLKTMKEKQLIER